MEVKSIILIIYAKNEKYISYLFKEQIFISIIRCYLKMWSFAYVTKSTRIWILFRQSAYQNTLSGWVLVKSVFKAIFIALN